MLRIMLKHLSMWLKRLSGSEAMNVHRDTDERPRSEGLAADGVCFRNRLDLPFSVYSFPGTSSGPSVSQSIQRRKS
jgi:hypothetical protein